MLCNNKMALSPCVTSASSYIFDSFMKSPKDLAQQLTRQWQRADGRLRQLPPKAGPVPATATGWPTPEEVALHAWLRCARPGSMA